MASHLIGAFPAHLDGRILRRRLHDLALEALRSPLQVGLADMYGSPFDHLAVQVVGIGALPQLHAPGVGLGLAYQVLAQARGMPDAQDQQSSGEGVQRAGVTDGAYADRVTRAGDDVV